MYACVCSILRSPRELTKASCCLAISFCNFFSFHINYLKQANFIEKVVAYIKLQFIEANLKNSLFIPHLDCLTERPR